MVAPVAAVGIAGLVLAKAAASIWFSTRATSPLSEPWRREFLDHSVEAIDKLEEFELADKETVAYLRECVEVLRQHQADGWGDADIFDKASYLSYYLGWKHSTTGLYGAVCLVGSYFDRTCMKIWYALMPPLPHTDEPIGAKADSDDQPKRG